MITKILTQLITKSFHKAYEYELKLTNLFNEILGIFAFGNFIIQFHRDVEIKVAWLKYYEYAIKSYAYYILLPCIFKTHLEQIKASPTIYQFFSEWPDAQKIMTRIEQEPEANGEDLEGIAEAFRNFFSPIVKAYMEFTGTFFTFARDLLRGGSYIITNFLREKNYNVIDFVEYINQAFRDYGERMRTINIPTEFYYQQRPTLDFDIIILFAHIQAFMTYREILVYGIEEKIKASEIKGLVADINYEDIIKQEIVIDPYDELKVCLPVSLVDQLKESILEIEIGKITEEKET